MDKILEQVARARRRLWMELFVNRLVWCWFACLLVAVVAIGAPKLVAMENLPEAWTSWWMGGALAGGILAALLWTLWRGRSELDAAIEIDRRFGLKERVASSLSLPASAHDSPAGQALLADALRAVQRVEVAQQFRIRLGRQAWLPLAPIVACALVLLVDNKAAQSSVDPSQTQLTEAERENIAKTRKRLAERRKKAEEAGLKEAEELFRELEEKSEQLSNKKATPDRKQAMVKLNDFAKQLEKRREKLGGEEQLRKQLNKLQGMNKGPADKMFDAMKQGDWKKAQQELKKLQEQLEKGTLGEQGQKDLQRQMDQLKEQLQKAAAQRQQAMEQLKQQIEQQKKQGNLAEAGRLQEKLDKMQRQAQQQQSLQKMAEQLAQCQQCLSEGDQKGAADAMQQMIDQVQQMQQQMAEGEMLDAALDQLEMAKDAVGCEDCQGAGCEACQGGMKPGANPNFADWARGAGAGGGKRASEKNDTRFRDSRVRQNVTPGAAVVTGEVDGPNLRGQVLEQLKAEMEAQGSEPADPLVIEQLPKSRRQHAEEYFLQIGPGETLQQ